jgi:hypothetical protein
MNPNEDSNIDDWVMNSEGLDDDPWNLDWGEFFAFDGQQPLQPSTDIPVDCSEQIDRSELVNGWGIVWEDALETNPVSELSQVVFPSRLS